ncbi:hypothetical protein XCV2922 [Xanthomonas euvesicatoria pv. vesicatoria str. 85-10]|uniref:Uncharacterized protein n=1 Tax=Xanthomonas euvesicatoria pv. vesicatoria (strain 85-10) TaxID=316273 RepID=Q3BRG0_XANE5|nr:hypothetical protein XCV2922 [Xanthomonas euvesicatoria pv. vesicatoria str. 85-10]
MRCTGPDALAASGFGGRRSGSPLPCVWRLRRVDLDASQQELAVEVGPVCDHCRATAPPLP